MPEPVSLEKVGLLNIVPAATDLTSVIARNKDELTQDFPGIDIRYSNVFRAIRSLNRARKNPEIEAYLLRTHFAVVGMGTIILNRTVKVEGYDDPIPGTNIAFWIDDDAAEVRMSAAKQLIERGLEIIEPGNTQQKLVAFLRPSDVDASRELANFMYFNGKLGRIYDLSADDQELASKERRAVYERY